jgi:hypothetical protein
MYDENAKNGFTFETLNTNFKADKVEESKDVPNYAVVDDVEYADCYGIRPCDVENHIAVRYQASIRGMAVKAYCQKTLSQCDSVAAMEHVQFIKEVFGLTL